MAYEGLERSAAPGGGALALGDRVTDQLAALASGLRMQGSRVGMG
jgi:hypothetical protein